MVMGIYFGSLYLFSIKTGEYCVNVSGFSLCKIILFFEKESSHQYPSNILNASNPSNPSS
jgi:hypothetical protein